MVASLVVNAEPNVKFHSRIRSQIKGFFSHQELQEANAAAELAFGEVLTDKAFWR
ncbi:hypothetical protein ACU8KH_02887 [Lachancea thermotolerans]